MFGSIGFGDAFSLSDAPPVYESTAAMVGAGALAGSEQSTSAGTATMAGSATVAAVGGLGSTPFAWPETVISQYANSPIMLAVLANFAACVDPTANLDQFFLLMRDLDTAVGYGLDVWGRIVGLPTGRTLTVEVGDFFGMTNSGGQFSGDSYDAAPFYAGGQLTTNYNLTDEAFRTLILAKAMSNISDGSIPSVNAILMTLFGEDGTAYVADGLNMTLTYTFSFALSPLQQAIVSQTGVLPKTTGVLAKFSPPF